jgi:hypothetical protein
VEDGDGERTYQQEGEDLGLGEGGQASLTLHGALVASLATEVVAVAFFLATGLVILLTGLVTGCFNAGMASPTVDRGFLLLMRGRVPNPLLDAVMLCTSLIPPTPKKVKNVSILMKKSGWAADEG